MRCGTMAGLNPTVGTREEATEGGTVKCMTHCVCVSCFIVVGRNVIYFVFFCVVVSCVLCEFVLFVLY